jgi:hypothetical protein
MGDRRRSSRFVFFAPADAQARTVSDAVVESWDGDSCVATTAHAATRGERFIIRHSSPSGEITTHEASVMSSTAVAGDGPMRFRLVLSIGPASPDLEFDPVPAF